MQKSNRFLIAGGLFVTAINTHAAGGTEVQLEPGVAETRLDALRTMGHQVSKSGWSFGGYQAIRIDPNSGILQGGSDPRKDGAAVGY